MIWWLIIVAGVILLILFAACGSCYDWGWQRGYRAGIDRGEQIDRLVGRADPLRGWNPPGHCCHGIPIENTCIDCASLTAGGGFDS